MYQTTTPAVFVPAQTTLVSACKIKSVKTRALRLSLHRLKRSLCTGELEVSVHSGPTTVQFRRADLQLVLQRCRLGACVRTSVRTQAEIVHTKDQINKDEGYRHSSSMRGAEVVAKTYFEDRGNGIDRVMLNVDKASGLQKVRQFLDVALMTRRPKDILLVRALFVDFENQYLKEVITS